MTAQWDDVKNLLVIRPDNMGDIIMMTPALRAIKNTFKCRLTMLTSKMGSLITPYIEEIDETIIADLPWVKTNTPADAEQCKALIAKLQNYHFDAVVISTVYSQNPLPAAMLAFMAGIPRRVAYCRENPYNLLTDWLPDKEPFDYVRHQVEREINLVEAIGAQAGCSKLHLREDEQCWNSAKEKIIAKGVDISKPWIIVHAGVSEEKREYPLALWVETVKELYARTGFQLLLTGSDKDRLQADCITEDTAAISLAGLLDIGEFIALIAHSELLLSVNTASVHIAAAVDTPVVVLYAQTNLQHTPWKVLSTVLPFTVPENLQSKNVVVQHARRKYFDGHYFEYPPARYVADIVVQILKKRRQQILLSG